MKLCKLLKFNFIYEAKTSVTTSVLTEYQFKVILSRVSRVFLSLSQFEQKCDLLAPLYRIYIYNKLIILSKYLTFFFNETFRIRNTKCEKILPLIFQFKFDNSYKRVFKSVRNLFI